MKNVDHANTDANLEKESVSHLEEEVRELRDKLSKLSTEKEVLAQQYQQYILRLNGQIRTINSQVNIPKRMICRIRYAHAILNVG